MVCSPNRSGGSTDSRCLVLGSLTSSAQGTSVQLRLSASELAGLPCEQHWQCNMARQSAVLRLSQAVSLLPLSQTTSLLCLQLSPSMLQKCAQLSPFTVHDSLHPDYKDADFLEGDQGGGGMSWDAASVERFPVIFKFLLPGNILIFSQDTNGVVFKNITILL